MQLIAFCGMYGSLHLSTSPLLSCEHTVKTKLPTSQATASLLLLRLIFVFRPCFFGLRAVSIFTRRPQYKKCASMRRVQQYQGLILCGNTTSSLSTLISPYYNYTAPVNNCWKLQLQGCTIATLQTIWWEIVISAWPFKVTKNRPSCDTTWELTNHSVLSQIQIIIIISRSTHFLPFFGMKKMSWSSCSSITFPA